MIVEGSAELREGLLQIEIAVACVLGGLGLLVRCGDDHANARENQDVISASPGSARARLDIAIEGLGLFERFLARENGVRAARRELSAVFRTARLKDHRLTLPGTRDIERASNGEELSAVIQSVLFTSIQKVWLGFVSAECVVFVRIPERAHDREVLLGASITHRVREVLLAPVVAGCALQTGRDDVPTGSAVADQVERGERARHVEGFVVRGGERRHEPDARGHSCHRRQQRQRLQAIQEVWR